MSILGPGSEKAFRIHGDLDSLLGSVLGRKDRRELVSIRGRDEPGPRLDLLAAEPRCFQRPSHRGSAGASQAGNGTERRKCELAAKLELGADHRSRITETSGLDHRML